jgi:hypothetical protein
MTFVMPRCYRGSMLLTLEIPDEIAKRIQETGDLTRTVLEAIALRGYRDRLLTEESVRLLLGFEIRYEVHQFLMANGVTLNYGLSDWEKDKAVADSNFAQRHQQQRVALPVA